MFDAEIEILSVTHDSDSVYQRIQLFKESEGLRIVMLRLLSFIFTSCVLFLFCNDAYY